MASSVSIDVDSEKRKDGDLQFQDIPHEDKWTPVSQSESSQSQGKTHTFTNFPHSAIDSEDDDNDEKTEFIKEKKNASFWTFEYYQQFFDVETTQVGQRILGSMVPRPSCNYLDSHIRPNPDLYGPFWICTTLVFTTAIAGNLANYIQAAGQNYHWAYDFHKVTFAATAIFSYWWVVPFVLFGLLWWRGNPARYTFLELICVYGYSLAIYIPISLLWVIPVGWLQWLLVVVGAVLSGSALLLTLWPAVREDKKQVAMTVMALIFLLHAALAMGFMLYFFHVPSRGTAVSPVNTTTAAPHNINPNQPPENVLLGAQQEGNKPPPQTNTAPEHAGLQQQGAPQHKPASQQGNPEPPPVQQQLSEREGGSRGGNTDKGAENKAPSPGQKPSGNVLDLSQHAGGEYNG